MAALSDHRLLGREGGEAQVHPPPPPPPTGKARERAGERAHLSDWMLSVCAENGAVSSVEQRDLQLLCRMNTF